MAKRKSMKKSRRQGSKILDTVTTQSQVRMASVPYPPPYCGTFVVTKTIRYAVGAGGASNVAISASDLLDTWLLATSTTALYRIASAVRIHQVQIWVSVTSSAFETNCYLQDNGTGNGLAGPSRTFVASSIGTDRPGHLVWSPSLGDSTQAIWQNNNTVTLFTVTIPQASIVDLTLSYSVQDGEGAVLAQNVGAAATTGAIYFRGFDGQAAAASIFTPVLLPTI